MLSFVTAYEIICSVKTQERDKRKEISSIVAGTDTCLCTDLLQACSLKAGISQINFYLSFISLSIASFLSCKIASVSDFAISVWVWLLFLSRASGKSLKKLIFFFFLETGSHVFKIGLKLTVLNLSSTSHVLK